MAAKTGPKYVMTNTHRDKIKNSNILSTLIKHVGGKQEMSASQVTAGLGLLKKIMPDLAATAFTDSEGNDIPVSLSLEVNRVKPKD